MDLKQYSRHMGKVKDRVRKSPVRRLLKSLPKMMTKDIQKFFAEKKGPNGVPWKPRKGRATHPLLILTGDMYRAAIAVVQKPVIRKTGMTVKLEEEKAPFHQQGTKNIPQRQFFGLSDETIEWMTGETGRSLVNIYVTGKEE